MDPHRRSLSIALILLSTSVAAAQIPADQAADMLLGSARKAYNERNYPFAATKFREFLQKFGGHPQANEARYGLALTLLEAPERDYAGAAEQLQALRDNRAFPDYPYVLYKLGLSRRGQGLKELAEADAKPNEAQQRRQNATNRFREAALNFGAAVAAFTDRVKNDPEVKELPKELEWAARARCDQAEMELRLREPKEAKQTTEAFVKNPILQKSRYARLGLYYNGYANYLLADYPNAARALNRNDLFADPVFGSHARFLMGRIHQNDGELAEATGQYDAVLADYAKQKAAAVEAVKRPENFKTNPEELARLKALVQTPLEHVAGATFFLAALQYEAGKFGDAQGRFAEFVKLFPQHPRVPEAQLRVGYCQVQTKQYPEAIAALTALANAQPKLADQALLWLGKAQAAHFDPNNPAARDAAQKAGIATLQKAAEKAGQLADKDPDAKARRAEILLELADTMQLAKQNRESAAVYEQLLNEKALPNRVEELTQRLAAAWHLAGDYRKSDEVCDRFVRDFPKSALRAAVLFRRAENAYFTALAADKQPNKNPAEVGKLFDEAGARFQTVVEKFPEFERGSLARFSWAMALYRKGDFEATRKVLEGIAPPDRSGELALTSYMLADCLIRLAPAKIEDDAIAAGKLQQAMTAAAALLDGFVGGNAQAPEAADALLKLGYCQQRLAQLLAQPQEKQAAIQAARAAYDKLMTQYAKDPHVAQAVLERAKVLVIAGDKNGAINECRRFTQAPLADSSVAPMALLRLATLLREQNQAPAAAQVLADARQKHEANLAKDVERTAWVPLLKYHHAVALLESAKVGDARGLFEQVVQQAAGKPIAAEAALRAGQCRLLDGRQKVEAAKQKLAQAQKPEDRAAAEKGVEEAYNAVRDAGKYLDEQAAAFQKELPNAEARARMLYDAAWAYRLVADREVAAILAKMRLDEQKRLTDEAIKNLPAGARPPVIPLPEVPRAKVPVQPAEEKARAAYKAMVGAFGDLPLATESRFELAEMMAERAEFDPAVEVLREALDKEPPQELTDRVRLRLGACLSAKKDWKGALVHFDAVSDPKSPHSAQAHYRAGECLIALGEFDKAAARLAIFRDKGEYQNVAGVTDRALLRLGYALAQLKQWEPSRLAYEQVVNRFGNGPWIHEARYGMGWARQNLKQYDEAVNAYSQVVAATTTELAAKAQLQIGLCRLDQKRYADASSALLVVPFTYDYPELTAAALCEAAKCFTELKQPAQAERLLQRVLTEHAGSDWAKIAKERLDALKKG